MVRAEHGKSEGEQGLRALRYPEVTITGAVTANC
jgi:hypothetical protein